MTITARYPGTCARCGGRIRAGEQIEWDSATRRTSHGACVRKGGSTGACAPKAPAVAPDRNRRPACCDRCGVELPAGTGQLQFCPADCGCPVHHDEDGWHVYCPDRATCDARRTTQAQAEETARAAANAAKEALAAAEAAWHDQVAALTAGLVRTDAGPRLYLPDIQAGELIATAPEGVASRPYHHEVDEVRRVLGDLVTVGRCDWVVWRWVSAQRAAELAAQA